MADHNFGVFPGQSPPDEQRLLNHSVPSTRTSVNTHRDKPTGKQIHQCTPCGNVFKKRSHLVEHIRTHTGDRPYHCSDCDSTFAYKDSRSHKGEKPFQCDSCSKAFSVKWKLKHHKETRH
ncbi:zinc finger protein 764-like [Amblyomma americanum]